MPTIPIKWLTDSNANKRYPVTHTKAVFDDNGDDLDTILSGLGGSAVEFVNFTESNGTWSCDTSIDTILYYVSNGKMVYGICYIDNESHYGIIPLTMYISDNSFKEVVFEMQVVNYSYEIYGSKYYDDGNNSWGVDDWSYYGEQITYVDFNHTTNTTIGTPTTTIIFNSVRSSKMITISNDLGITFSVSNGADNYLWIKNTGSSEVDIVINSVSYGYGGTPLSNVYMPSDGITVPAGGLCEIGIIINDDGAFITSRNDLAL